MNSNNFQHIREAKAPVTLAFDADDTLWDNQSHYDHVEEEYCHLLSPFASEQTIRHKLYAVEMGNMPAMGYGTKAFMLSLMQNALQMTEGQVDGVTLQKIYQLGLDLLQMPATPFEGVAETLEQLKSSGRFRLVCFTKGDLLDQENKLRRSGLMPLFHHVEIVSEKTTDDYLRLMKRMETTAERFVMIGNSFKSDIHPVLEIGGWGIHIPFKRVWLYEQIEEYAHPRMLKLETFRQLTDVFNV